MHTPYKPEQQPAASIQACSSGQRSAACHTPQECATMMDAVEQAMQHAQECTPDSRSSRGVKAGNLQDWIQTAGVQMPTPAAKDLQVLVDAAADNRRLRKQLEALREAELELAAREAEETAQTFSMLEEENMGLASKNAQLQQRIAELEALAEAAEAAAQAQQQQQQADSPEPTTPQHQRMRALGLNDEGPSMQERATSVLKRAAAASRLSGMYEEEHQAKLRELCEAESRLSIMKSQAPGSTQSQHTAMQQRLTAAEQQVEEAAAAAREATAKLQALQQEKEEVQQELAALRQQLQAQPDAAAQHAELYEKLLEAQQQLLQEKQQSQQLAGSLLEHAGRLSHKYYNLSDDYDALEHRYHQLNHANEQLAGRLKEAHEALFEVQTAVQSTPVHKRKEQRHLLSRLSDAEQAVTSLAREKHQLQERLLQAQAFISCLQQRTAGPASTAKPPETQQRSLVAVLQTLAGAADAAMADSPHYGVTDAMAGSAAAAVGSQPVLALPAPATFSTPASSALLTGQAHAAFSPPGTSNALLQQPVSPILAAAAARSKTVGERRSAAHEELQDVQQQQRGLHDEISRAESALADIAGQLRASIGASRAALSKPAQSGSNSSMAGDSSQQVAGAVPGVLRNARQAAASAVSEGVASEGSNSSGSSRATTNRASRHSKVASAARSYGPGRLQELQKAAAAVKSATTARSGVSSSASKGGSSSVASRAPPKPHFMVSMVRGSAAAAGVGVAASALSGSNRQWDQLSESGSAGNSPNKQAAGANAAISAAGALAAPVGSSSASVKAASASSGAGSAHGAGCSSVRTAACLGTHSAAASDSGKGSISLDQLIADAENVSLEYGMSPGGYAAGTAAAARDAAAAAAADSMPVLVTPSSAADSRFLTGEHAKSMAQQQGTEPFAFKASQMGRTPGSAASSAGAGGPGAQQQQQHGGWVGQQHLWEMSPASVAGAGLQLEDMQSCMRPAGPGSSARAANQQHSVPSAATPAGLERVASNTMLDQLVLAAAPAAAQTSLRRVRQGLQLQTPTNLAGICTDDTTGAHAASSVEQPTEATDITAHDASTAVAAVAGLTELQSSEASAGHSAATGATGSASGSCGQHLQQEVTLVQITSAGQTTAPVVQIASPPSALKKAAAALLASISPAGLVTAATPEAAAAPQASPAGVFLAGLQPQLLQHLTPQWLRSLKRKCKQESEQLQQLRRQMGLNTPEGLLAAQQQASARSTPAAAAAAAALGNAAGQGLDTSAGSATQMPAAQVANPAISSDTQGLMLAGTGSVLVASTATTLDAVLQMRPEPVSAASVPAAECASSTCTGRQVPGAAGSHSATALGQNGSRVSIDRLRRRAIMAQATAAAASPLADTGTDAAPAGEIVGASAPSLEAAAAATGITGVPKALARAAADAASWDDQLDRIDSAGSLADYMKGDHGGNLRDDVRAPGSRTGSITPGMLLPRPECPTPGSMYSEVNDALSSAGDALSGRDSPVSPDMLLAGLRSSRLAARQLQQQLMQQLENTTYMPSTLPRQHEAALGPLRSGPLPITSSAAATVAAAAAAKAAAADAAAASGNDSGSCCGSPALEACTQLVAVSPDGEQQQHRQLSRLLEGAGATAAASPSTPGAALNAGAESRLLSPGAQLQLVFDDQDALSGEEVAGTAQQPIKQWREQQVLLLEVSEAAAAAPDRVGGRSRSLSQQSQSAMGASPAASDGSFCMLPLGVAAKAQPRADSAVVAPSPPASVMAVTPGFSGSQGSIKAHPLSSVSDGTVTATAVTPLSSAQQDASGPRPAPPAPVSTNSPASSGLRPSGSQDAVLGSRSRAAEQLASAAHGNSRSSGSRRSASQPLDASQDGPSLGSWAGAAAGTAAASATAAGGAASVTGTPGSWAGSCGGSVTKGRTAHSAGTNTTASSIPAELASVDTALEGYRGVYMQQEGIAPADRAPGLPIMLGDSPSSKAQQGMKGSGGSASSASGSWGAAAATPGSASVTSNRCMSVSVFPGPRPSLGTSPDSANQEAAQTPPPTAAGMVTAHEATAAAAAAAAAEEDETAVIAAAAHTLIAGAECASAGVAAAHAAIAAAFAMATPPVASTAAPAAAAPGPAASSSTWNSGSYMYATPAAALNSPGGTYGAYSDVSDAQYYTGLQDSNSSRFVASTAATTRHRAAAASSDSADSATAAAEGKEDGEAAATGTAADVPVAFAGFRVQMEDALGSPVLSKAAAEGPAAAPAAAAATTLAAAAGGRGMTATAQKRMLQELLASPSDDSGNSTASQDSSLSPASATRFERGMSGVTGGSVAAAMEEPLDADVTSAAPAVAAECVSPLRNVTETAGSQQQQQEVVNSPTLSELGFVAASASADVAAAKRLQQQQQQEAEGSRRIQGADLAGLSFKQRLELLCSDGEEGESSDGCRAASSPGSCTGGRVEGGMNPTSPQSHDEPITTAAEAAAATHWDGEDVAQMASPGAHGSGMACCATQTTPHGLAQATAGDQGHWRFREAGVQVPTPVHHAAQSKQGAAGSGSRASTTKQPTVTPCDVTASPIKGRDQC